MQLDLQIACEEVGLPEETSFRLWVDAALTAAEEPRTVVTIRLADAVEVQELNRSYRDKDRPTNVLSFPFEPMPGIDEETLGDVVICKDVVEAEATAQDKLPEAHWAHIVIHGILHLCGYDHITDKEAAQMESLEIAVLSGLGYTNPYNE